MPDDVVQIIPKDPRDPDATLDDVLKDIVELTKFNHRLLRYVIRKGEVELVYEPPK